MGGVSSPISNISDHYSKLNSLYHSSRDRLNEDYTTMLSTNTEIDLRLKNLKEGVIAPLENNVLQSEKARYCAIFIRLKQSFKETTSLKGNLARGVLRLTNACKNPLSSDSLKTLSEYGLPLYEAAQKAQGACSGNLKMLKTYLAVTTDLSTKMKKEMVSFEKTMTQFFRLDKGGISFDDYLKIPPAAPQSPFNPEGTSTLSVYPVISDSASASTSGFSSSSASIYFNNSPIPSAPPGLPPPFSLPPSLLSIPISSRTSSNNSSPGKPRKDGESSSDGEQPGRETFPIREKVFEAKFGLQQYPTSSSDSEEEGEESEDEPPSLQRPLPNQVGGLGVNQEVILQGEPHHEHQPDRPRSCRCC